jgi:hypothetical protein
MNTKFVDLDIPFTGEETNLPEQIETALRQWGEPLRWSITRVDSPPKTMHVEAIVTTDSINTKSFT